METQKTILLTALFFISFLLWKSWGETFPGEESRIEVAEVVANSDVPTVDNVASGSKNSIVPSVTAAKNKNIQNVNSAKQDLITIATDLVEYKIDRVGGDIVQVKLLKYNNSLEDKQPMVLLNNTSENIYIAPNGLTGVNGPDTQNSRAVYTTSKSMYLLDSSDYNNQEQYKVNLVLANGKDKNVDVIKTFVFNKNTYDVEVQYTINNNSNASWDGNIFSVLKRKKEASKSSSFISPTGYVGLAAYSNDDKFHKLSTDSLSSAAKNWSTTSGWAAMMQHYFISVWIPEENDNYRYMAKLNNDDTYMVTLVGPNIHVAPGSSVTKAIKFYSGPEKVKELGPLATGLNRTVDYGIMWPVASLIFTAMSWIYGVVGNWGLAIILVTILIKLLFYRLSSSSYRSMAKLKVLAPKIEQLRKRYGEDKEKMGKAMMELYKKEKVNPLGGCLPMLIQLPFFIALYWVIIESVELRQAPFVLWIQDLSVKDPYYMLPILMGVSMLAQQKLNPPAADPTQEKMMMLMPIIFTALFMYFPAGLVLYWVVNTVTSIMQQWWIMKTVNADRAKTVVMAKAKN